MARSPTQTQTQTNELFQRRKITTPPQFEMNRFIIIFHYIQMLQLLVGSNKCHLII